MFLLKTQANLIFVPIRYFFSVFIGSSALACYHMHFCDARTDQWPSSVAHPAMESHVLIPNDLVLSVRATSDSASTIARLLEPVLTVTAACDLAKGTRLHPAQGSVRCARLEVYSSLPTNDVSKRMEGI